MKPHLVLTIALATGCAQSIEPSTRSPAGGEDLHTELAQYHKAAYEDFRARRASFDPSDGIDRQEALLLAHEYFTETFGLCGAVDRASWRPQSWSIHARIGFGADPLKPNIQVDRTTGSVSHPDGEVLSAAQLFEKAEHRYRTYVARFANDPGSQPVEP